MITPNSDVILLKCPIELSQQHQLTFANATAQYNYFNGLTKLSVGTAFTYQRKDGTIRVPQRYDDIISYNYVMYRNDNYSNKWFYAFIEGMEYVNDGMTAVKIKTDVYQTWMFDMVYKSCFVEREHANSDTVGSNTIPENLELGEYVQNGTPTNNYLSTASSETNASWICFQVSDYPDGNGALSPSLGDDVEGRIIGGVYSGLTYLFVLLPEHANRLIRCYDLADKADAIVSIFTVPLGLLAASNLSIVNHTDPDNNMITIGILTSGSSAPFTINTTTLTKPSTIDGYTPKNNKLLSFPYCYFYATNNSGTEVEYHWEDFNGNPSFTVDGTVCQGMAIKAYPTNYKRGTSKDGYNFGINAGKFPTCAWASDYYINWCTQNAVNQPLQVASSITGAFLGSVGSLMAGNPLGAAGAIAGGITGVGQAVARRYEAKLTPDQARGNANCGDLNVAETRMGFTFYPMSIKAEYARICDDFFSMYGY